LDPAHTTPIDRTSTILLDGLAQTMNQGAWIELDERYRPILVGFARRTGYSDDDAAELAQEALGRFISAFRSGGYERERGRLRSWMIGIVRNCMHEHERGAGRQAQFLGQSVVERLPGPDALESMWDTECQKSILQRALGCLENESSFAPKTIQAFEMVALEFQPVKAVSAALGMSTNDVYVAKHRCLRKLVEIVSRLNLVYENEPRGES
jgi:RNA polymerase sigma factor (sigma-70 family)